MLAQQMERLNRVIDNLEDSKEIRESFDAEIDGLRNRVDQCGNNVRKCERCVSPHVDDDFDEMGDGNYDSVTLGHKDQFGHLRNDRYGGVMKD
jgi:hypothetical protein